LVLSVGAGLLLRSFLHLLSLDPGFRPGKSVRVTVTLPAGGYSELGQVRGFYDRAIEAARSLPGVLAIGAGSDLPLGVRERRAFTADRPTRPISGPSRVVAPTWISPGYFDALRMPLEPGGLSRTINIVVRSERDSSSLIADLRHAVQGLDASLPISKAQPLDEMIGESLRPRRFSMTVVLLFAAVALGLAAIGIYGVLAGIVTQQTREIAIRMALGATASGVIWMILRRALILMSAGIGIGVAGALATTRVMVGLLFEVRPTDAVAFFGATVLLALLALFASLAPAWRAIRVDPLVALKAE
jgi:hypothetical protein